MRKKHKKFTKSEEYTQRELHGQEEKNEKYINEKEETKHG